jgi:hypothetical protein
MKPRSSSLFKWWLAGTGLYGILVGCTAVAFGFIDAWSFGMNGQNVVLFRNRLLFPTQIIEPLPELFDLGHIFLHSFLSGAVYATLGIAAVFGYQAIERFKKGE